MKKTSKILLSALAISSMFFTMTVNAEEQTSANNTQVVQQANSYKSIETITDEEVKNIIPNEFEVNITKTEYSNFIIDCYNYYDSENYSGGTCPITDKLYNEVEQKLIALFNENGYALENIDGQLQQYEIDFEKDFGEGKLEKAFIRINSKSLTDSTYDKDITIKFAKESNYNTSDETYVQNAVKNMKFAQYQDDFIEKIDAVFTIYNIGDEESASKWTENTYNFSKLLNDNSIVLKKTDGYGGFGGGTPWGLGTILYFYKNDVLYATKHVMNMGMYGTILENGTPVNMGLVEKDDEVYKAMSKELENNGLTNIIGCYELTAYGTIGNDTKVSFNLGTNYNGKEVQILHKKHDNTYELFKTKVSEGKATISVSELSPFMIALSNTTETNNNVNEIVNNAPNNAQTSSLDIVLYSTLAIGSLLGIAYIVIKGKKKVA